MRRRSLIRKASTFVVLCAVLDADHARVLAQGPQPGTSAKADIWVGVNAPLDRSSVTAVSAFAPPLLQDGAFTSRAGQTLSGDATHMIGLTGGIGFAARPIGVELMLDWSRRGVAGLNGPYAFALTYTSREPPDDRLQTIDVSRSVTWPDTSGAIGQLAIAGNVTYRIGRVARPHVRLFGGPVWCRTTGHLEPLAFTNFHLGGHSVLFEDEYRLVIELAPSNTVGLNLGGDVRVPIAQAVALVLGARYFAAGDVETTASPSAVLNPETISMAVPLDAIAAAIAPIHVRLNPSAWRAIVGVAWHP